MDPVYTIKRKRPTDIDKLGCLFCNKTTDDIRIASPEGKERTWIVAQQRRKHGDTSYADVLERLDVLSEEQFYELEIRWHKNCYSSFSSKSKLDRLKKRHETSSGLSSASATTDHSASTSSAPTTRSSKSAINWSLCMFCQMVGKRKVHRVQTFEKSTDIIEHAKTDPVMSIRLSGVSDLIAAEGCYHLGCLIAFERRSVHVKTSTDQQEPQVDDCMMKVCRDLGVGLSRGHVYKMGDVWDRYQSMCIERQVSVPMKYLSRRTTFYEKVQLLVGKKASYVKTLANGQLLMYPGEKSDFIISKTLSKSNKQQENLSSDSESTDDEDTSVLDIAQGNIFQEMVHVALRVRRDLLDTPGHSSSWHNLNQDHVDQVIPNSLYLFLRLLFGGIDMVHESIDDDDIAKQAVCSIAQDIVYAVSNKRKLTPKHIGLGLALHQATRSEALVDLFHAANHTIGIDTVRRIDTTIAQNILERFAQNGNVYVPDNIVKERMIHCSCDNIDVLEATLDGKNTFHCTQMMVWQRGPPRKQGEDDQESKHIVRERNIKANALQEFQKLDHAALPSGQRPSHSFHGDNKIVTEMFNSESDQRLIARAKDFAWVVSRIYDNGQDRSIPAWGSLNEAISTVDPPVTTAGMLPILQAPADDNNTLTTVINRFMAISNHTGQKYTIITADQPLYSREKELVWANPKFENVIFLMGGLHICFNFLKAIGQHMESSGLDDLWTESGVYAANTTETMLDGKAYYRAVRGHQLTYEALWHIKWSMFQLWLREKGKEDEVEVEKLAQHVADLFKKRDNSEREDICDAVGTLADYLRGNDIQDLLKEFSSHHADNPNFKLWSQYMEMIEILLDFIRAQRDGNWGLHLEAFSAMLPWFTIYDHTNYARWGPIYLADMKLLEKTAPEVYTEFRNGNFVVKRTKRRFNQVSADQATEWMNKICKMQNGIIGITRNDQARDKFCITWSERSAITQDMRVLFNLDDDEEETAFTRSDSLPSRTKRDTDDVKKLFTQLTKFDVFRTHTTMTEREDVDAVSDVTEIPLVSLATKDIATSEVVADLLTAKDRGKQCLMTNVKERLIEDTVGFHDTMKKNRSKTFADLYKATVNTKQNVQKTIKADRKLLQRLLNAATGGRPLEMMQILKHELSPVPLSLAKAGGEMNSTPKSELISILMAGLDTPPEIPNADMKTCVLIDGHALIQALGKPHGCQTFGDYADVFIKSLTKYFGENTKRVDIVFDRYIGEESIKAVTRSKRMGKKKPIRKLIDGPDVPLPQVWSNFIALDENKADLAKFLSEVIIEKGKDLPKRYEIVAGGGFLDATDARSTRRDDIRLHGNHEEADTRLILHSCEAVSEGFERIVVICRDTDVMLLLLHFVCTKAREVWMLSGTAAKRKCYPIHAASERLTQPMRDNLLSFHTLTGCDTTSSFHGHGKKLCWKVYQKNPQLLTGIGRDGDLAPIEKFVCDLYGTPEQPTVNHARLQLFGKAKKGLEMLPPTVDALELHAVRANYQAKIWMQADKESIEVISPTNTEAWKMESGHLEAVWTRLPAIPDACLELVTCGCQSKCRTARCTCFRKNLKCTVACGCDANDCNNPAGQ